MPHVEVSLVVPLYNEEENVERLYQWIRETLVESCRTYELVFVNDGSRDKTQEILEKIAERDERVTVARFRRNYGQTAAMVAGFQIAAGRIVVTMDGDLQNDPNDIERLVEKMDEGYDLVVGWRRRRQDKYFTRILPSRIANWIISRLTGVPIRDNGCSLKAYRASMIKQMSLYSEMHRFIPAMTSLAGTRVAEIEVTHHPRRYGTSKYGLSRTFKVIADLLTVRVLLRLLDGPFRWLLGATTVSALAALAAFVGWLASVPSESIVTLGIAGLFAYLAAFLLFLGVLTSLILRFGEFTPTDYAELLADKSVWSRDGG